jgi:iron complex transport system permease protein
VAVVSGKDRKGVRTIFKRTVLLALPIMIFILSFTIGRYPISPGELFSVMAAKFLPLEQTWPATLDTVVFQVRLPRILAAVLVGAALATSGAAYQGMFRNPLVSPDILGASAGACFGAALAIFCSLNYAGIQILSFVFGLVAVLITYAVSSRIRHESTLTLVLSGILIGTLFTSGTSLLKYMADPFDKLPAITYWLMGSLSSISSEDVLAVILPMLAGGFVLYLVRWRLNVLSLGEEEVSALGLDTRKLKMIVILCATMMTSAAVSISGMIGWVGLIVPHLARMIVGPNYKVLLPASIIIGGTYLLLVDDLARVMASVEIPLGILTSIIGAPFFIYLLMHSRRGWQ